MLLIGSWFLDHKFEWQDFLFFVYIVDPGHLNVDTSNLHMVAISKSYFRNRVNMGRPVGRFARYAMEEVIRAMDVPTISDCETPGLSMQESSEIYKGAIER